MIFLLLTFLYTKVQFRCVSVTEHILVKLFSLLGQGHSTYHSFLSPLIPLDLGSTSPSGRSSKEGPFNLAVIWGVL